MCMALHFLWMSMLHTVTMSIHENLWISHFLFGKVLMVIYYDNPIVVWGSLIEVMIWIVNYVHQVCIWISYGYPMKWLHSAFIWSCGSFFVHDRVVYSINLTRYLWFLLRHVQCVFSEILSFGPNGNPLWWWINEKLKWIFMLL